MCLISPEDRDRYVMTLQWIADILELNDCECTALIAHATAKELASIEVTLPF